MMNKIFMALGMMFALSIVPSAFAVVATGGTITYDGAYTIHSFTHNETTEYFTVTTGGNIEILVVGGGGQGGGTSNSGGGGAGGYVNCSSYAVTAQIYTVRVGGNYPSGGDPSSGTVGTNGYPSFFNSSTGLNITAIGGGGGGTSVNINGVAGASGGGGAENNGAGGAATQTDSGGCTGFGFAGGAAGVAGNGGGGGGGAGGTGNSSDVGAGSGGVGKYNSINGTSVYYAVGGSGYGTSGNGSAGRANSGNGGTHGSVVIYGGAGGSGVVIIRYIANPDMTIYYPQNITYYNNFTLPLNVSNNTFNASAWFYSLNGGINISFTPNTTLSSYNYGQSCINVWVNDTSNNWYNSLRCWTNSAPSTSQNIITVCNSTNVNQLSCSADGFSVLKCIQMTYTSYQWDLNNITNCPYGCWNGACLVPSKTCQDVCTINSTKCLDQSSYVSCKFNTDSGCYEWSVGTFCNNGCSNGACNGKLRQCMPYTMKCQDAKNIVWCLDEGNTGEYAWSQINKTVCDFQCIENMTSNKVVAYCTAHSMTDELYGLKQSWNYVVGGIMYATEGNQKLLLPIAVFLTMIIGLAVGIFMKSSMMGVISIGVALFLFTAGGWIPWALTIIIFIVAGFIMFKMVNTGDENE